MLRAARQPILLDLEYGGMPARYGTENDPRDTATLIRFAVRAKTLVASRNCLKALAYRDPDEVLSAAESLCSHRHLRKRIIGAEMAGRIGCTDVATAKRASRMLTQMLLPDKSDRELRTALKWICHFAQRGNLVGLGRIRALARRPNAAVRLGVAQVLGSQEDPASTKALIRLMSDPSPRVRDWATFAIGALRSEDSARIRDALAARLDDEDEDAFAEAVYGLAKRNDNRGFAAMRREFDAGEPTSLVIRAAKEFGEGRFTASLRRLLRESVTDKDIDPTWLSELESAVRASSADAKQKR
ncbi:MAG: hypothetical protein CMJ58_22270 [Planctomycetaceae bacterium]|nr:hypothetical protein [Planctomycetaceae bacterium]